MQAACDHHHHHHHLSDVQQNTAASWWRIKTLCRRWWQWHDDHLCHHHHHSDICTTFLYLIFSNVIKNQGGGDNDTLPLSITHSHIGAPSRVQRWLVDLPLHTKIVHILYMYLQSQAKFRWVFLQIWTITLRFILICWCWCWGWCWFADSDVDGGIPIRVTLHIVHLTYTLRASHDTRCPSSVMITLISWGPDQNLMFHQSARVKME